MSLYVYRARIVNVVDGDTFDAMIDPGFHLTYAARVRLADWDTPELRRGSEFEKERGRDAASDAEAWIEAAGEDLHVVTSKSDSFGRWLAALWNGVPNAEGSESLGPYLGGQRLATPWPTRWRDVYDGGEA